MKICCKCKLSKNFEEFQKEKRKLDGFSARCKICLNQDKKNYLDTKRDKIREYNRKKYYEDHEKNRKLKTERSKKFRKDNYEKYREIQKEWRLKNPEKVRLQALLISKTDEYKNKRNKRLRENKKVTDIPKMRARKILQSAVKVGYLNRPKICEICKSDERKIEAHHDDYNKPLEVRWLCRICHAHQHSKLMDVKP